MDNTTTRFSRSPAPKLIFLFGTLTLTVAATGLLCLGIMSDHWEEINWDRNMLERVHLSPTWYLNGKVAKLEQRHNRNSHHHRNRNLSPIFLVPMHGGIWSLCISLRDDELHALYEIGFPQNKCINYLSPDEAHEEMRAAWQNRMQNLSISCSLVCLIILGSAIFVGLFGLCSNQVSAVLVTGVMYLLAAIFALFTLTIMHSKRNQDRNGRIYTGLEDGAIGGPVDPSVLKARHIIASWSMDFGWSGVIASILASMAWILLSKIMRFSPITAVLS